MSVFNNILAGAAGQSGGSGSHTIDRSLRFDSGSNSYLSRTPSSAGNRNTWTWSGWVKRTNPGTGNYLFMCQVDSSNYSEIYFDTDDKIKINNRVSGSNVSNLITNAVYRDVSAWYHLVVASDSSTLLKLYVNGTEVTDFTSTGPTTANWSFNSTSAHAIGANNTGAGYHLNGYLADVHFIDGQALAATDFGEFDDIGVWQPKQVSGVTYGTNGFHLNFSDNSSTTSGSNTGIGKDTSGNQNYFDSNNISVASGGGNDSLRDSPSSYVDGSIIGGNYATLNPLATDSKVVLSNGNLDFDSGSSSGYANARSTIGVSSGKWYAEFYIDTSACYIGVIRDLLPTNSWVGDSIYGWAYHPNGQIYHNNSSSSYGSTFVSGDLIGLAFDADNRTATWYKNGTSQGSYSLGNAAQAGHTFFFAGGGYVSDSFTVNFGQRPFQHPPGSSGGPSSDYKSLCTQNFEDPVISEGSTAMDVALYTGVSSNQAITGLEFSPDFLWIKRRDLAGDNFLFNTIRGRSKCIKSNTNDDETTSAANRDLVSFDSNGFTVGTVNQCSLNITSATYAAWAWEASDSNTSLSAGSLDSNLNIPSSASTVRTNSNAGFSIVNYTGSGNVTTIRHNLGAKPAFMMFKRLDQDANWAVYHEAIGAQKFLRINTNTTPQDNNSYFDDTEPTSEVFTAGSHQSVNSNNNSYIAYCWAPVAGYSAFGEFDATQPFVYLGFTPRWLLLKDIDYQEEWCLYDTAREPFNPNDTRLEPSTSSSFTTHSNIGIDFLSNGFKIRGTHSTIRGHLVYAAFASKPFKYARAH